MLGFRGLALVLLCILPVYLGVSYAFFTLNFAYLTKKKKKLFNIFRSYVVYRILVVGSYKINLLNLALQHQC